MPFLLQKLGFGSVWLTDVCTHYFTTAASLSQLWSASIILEKQSFAPPAVFPLHCSEPMQRLHYPQPHNRLPNEHAQSFVLPWTAVGENGSVHARTAGKTFNDFCVFHSFKIGWSIFFTTQKTHKEVYFSVWAWRNAQGSNKFTRGVALEWLLTS